MVELRNRYVGPNSRTRNKPLLLGIGLLLILQFVMSSCSKSSPTDMNIGPSNPGRVNDDPTVKPGTSLDQVDQDKPPVGVTQIRGTVSKSVNSPAGDGKGTVCLVLSNECLSMPALERKTYKGYATTRILNSDLSTMGRTIPFAFNIPKGALPNGVYVIVGILQEKSGECGLTWFKNDPFTWESCTSVSFIDGAHQTGLNVVLNNLVPRDVDLRQVK